MAKKRPIGDTLRISHDGVRSTFIQSNVREVDLNPESDVGYIIESRGTAFDPTKEAVKHFKSLPHFGEFNIQKAVINNLDEEILGGIEQLITRGNQIRLEILAPDDILPQVGEFVDVDKVNITKAPQYGYTSIGQGGALIGWPIRVLVIRPEDIGLLGHMKFYPNSPKVAVISGPSIEKIGIRSFSNIATAAARTGTDHIILSRKPSDRNVRHLISSMNKVPRMAAYQPEFVWARIDWVLPGTGLQVTV